MTQQSFSSFPFLYVIQLDACNRNKQVSKAHKTPHEAYEFFMHRCGRKQDHDVPLMHMKMLVVYWLVPLQHVNASGNNEVY